MPKTPEEVIAKYQRKMENTARHITNLIDSMEGWKRQTKKMEDLLAYAHRQLDPLRDDEVAIRNVLEAIEKVIPGLLTREELD